MQRHEVGTPERALGRLGQADQIWRSYETILVSEPSLLSGSNSPTEGTGEVPQPTQRLDVTQRVSPPWSDKRWRNANGGGVSGRAAVPDPPHTRADVAMGHPASV
jgi:hypothetical protein